LTSCSSDLGVTKLLNQTVNGTSESLELSFGIIFAETIDVVSADEPALLACKANGGFLDRGLKRKANKKLLQGLASPTAAGRPG
jgi:hypothetical protein